jgi:hypothetical protein
MATYSDTPSESRCIFIIAIQSGYARFASFELEFRKRGSECPEHNRVKSARVILYSNQY